MMGDIHCLGTPRGGKTLALENNNEKIKISIEAAFNQASTEAVDKFSGSYGDPASGLVTFLHPVPLVALGNPLGGRGLQGLQEQTFIQHDSQGKNVYN